MRANWLALWSKLAPLWAAVWLCSALIGPTQAWVHADGSPCAECSREISVVVAPEPCCPPSIPIVAPVPTGNCRSCCSPAKQQKQPAPITVAPIAALLPPRVVFEAPLLISTEIQPRPVEHRHTSPSRAPPRGRGPPLDFASHT